MRVHEFIYEGWLESLISGTKRVFSSVANVFRKIAFGQSTVIDLNKYLKSSISEDMPTEKRDLTSMIGYYNEFCVAWKLAEKLEHTGVNIDTNADVGLAQFANNYRQNILSNSANFGKTEAQINTELQRVEDGSEVMSDKMFEEIAQANDLKLIDVRIELTGGSAKFSGGKEDIRVIIRKRDTGQVTDMIKASLKLYKTPGGINLYNATFPSYLVTVLTGNSDATGPKAVENFLTQYPEYREEMEKVLGITNQWLQIKKSSDRETANAFITKNRGYQQMRDLLFGKIFNDFYEKDKAAINERILKRLGLDGADEVYLLVGTQRQKMVAISSRTSEEFKALYDALKQNFNIRFVLPNSPDIVNSKMLIEDENGTVLASFGLSFKEGGTFPHTWDASSITRAEREKLKNK